MKYNSDEVKNTFSIPPIGKAKVKIIAASDRRSSTGKDMIEIKAEVTSDQGKGCHLYDYIVEGEWASSRIAQVAAAIGRKVADGQDVKPAFFQNGTGTVQIKHDSYEGQTRPKIAYWVARELDEKEPEATDDKCPF